MTLYMTLQIWDDESQDYVAHRIPAAWTICQRCHGDGTHCGGIVVTGADLDEMYADDWDARDDFIRSMRSGWYRCEDCSGTGKVLSYIDGEDAPYTEEQRALIFRYIEQEAERKAEAYADAQMRRAESGYSW